MRALTHIHSVHSWDSRNAVPRLADALDANGIELALVSDHDDFAGSIELRALVDERGLDLRVPVAAEVRTDHGDVIVVFEDSDPPEIAELKRWERLPTVVRERGGLIWLPHPFQSHTDVERLASESDVIEIFNARCSAAQNAAAVELCRRHGAVPAFGADIHRLSEIGRFVANYEPAASVLSMLRSTPTCENPVATRKSDIMAAEVVNGFKRRRPTLVGYFALRWFEHRVRETRRASR